MRLRRFLAATLTWLVASAVAQSRPLASRADEPAPAAAVTGTAKKLPAPQILSISTHSSAKPLVAEVIATPIQPLESALEMNVEAKSPAEPLHSAASPVPKSNSPPAAESESHFQPGERSVTSQRPLVQSPSALGDIAPPRLADGIADIPDDPNAETETTLFDLYVADALQGSILVTYTDDWFQVATPGDIIDQIPAVTDKAAVERAFSGKIRSSRETPDVASIRIDLNTFRIIVTVAPSHLVAQNVAVAGALGDPEKSFAVQQKVNAALSGQLDQQTNASVNYRGVASYRKFRSRLDATYIQDADAELTEMSAANVVGGYQLEAGMLRTLGQQFVSSADFAGVSLRTVEDLFTGQEQLRGSKLEIYVPSRARVEFFRNGRLLSVQVLNFGLQEVDTSAFPQGSYDVDIVINEDNGGVVRDTRFFAKSGLLAIRSKPVISLAAGQARNKFDVLDVPVYEATGRYRATDILQFNGSVFGTDSLQVGSMDLLGISGNVVLGLGASLSSAMDAGYRASVDGTIFGLMVGVNVAQAFGDDSRSVRSTEPLPGSTRPIEPLTFDERVDLLRLSRSSINASISKQWDNLTLKLALNQNVIGNRPERLAYGPTLVWRFLQRGTKSFAFQTSALNTDDGPRLEAFFTYRQVFGAWSVNSRLGENRLSQSNDTAFITSATYDTKRSNGKGTRFTFTDELRRFEKLGADEEKQQSATNSIEVDHTNDMLAGRSFVRDRRFSGEDTTTVGLNAESVVNVVDGALSVARPVDQSAVLIVEVKSDSTATEVEVLIDGQVYDTMQAGSTVSLGLTPYKTYRVSIRPATSSDLITYDASVQTITFFPGNVVKRSWAVERVFIGLGKIVDPAGQPIGWQRIKGLKEYIVTEPNGTFQAEMTGKETLTIEREGSVCNVALPQRESVEYFTDFGTVVCVEHRGAPASEAGQDAERERQRPALAAPQLLQVRIRSSRADSMPMKRSQVPVPALLKVLIRPSPI